MMTREEFKKNAKRNMDEIFEKLQELEAKKDLAVLDAKLEYEEKITELKKKKIELKQKYEQLENASEEKWEEVKNAFAAASVNFREGFQKIGAIFK